MTSTADPVIELATAADVETIADRWVELARDQRVHGSHVLADENRTAMRATLAAHRLEDGLLVARLDGDLVGFASFSLEHGALELDVDRGVLSNLYVDPDVRTQGIGSALLQAVEDALAARGAEVLSLEVMAENAAARRFYRREGYEPYRVAMERRLTPENDTHTKKDA